MTLITRELFTRDQWQTYKPESMHSVIHDERYFCFWQVDATNRGLMIFDFTGEGAGVIHSDLWASAAYSDPKRDALFLSLPSDTALHKWDADASFLTMRWRSKEYVLDRQVNIGVAQIIGDFTGRTCTLKVYGDGVLEDTVMVTASTPFMLDRDYHARKYQFEVEGTAVVKEMLFAPTVKELVSG